MPGLLQVKLLLFTSRIAGAAVAIAFHSSWPTSPRDVLLVGRGRSEATQAVESRGADQGDGEDGEAASVHVRCGPQGPGSGRRADSRARATRVISLATKRGLAGRGR